MAEKRNTRRLYSAIRSFRIDGYTDVRLGDIAEEGAAILSRRPDAFRLLAPRFSADPRPVAAPDPSPEPEPDSEP